MNRGETADREELRVRDRKNEIERVLKCALWQRNCVTNNCRLQAVTHLLILQRITVNKLH